MINEPESVEVLARTVAAVVARAEISELLYRYSDALDRRSVEDFLECFASTAVWRSTRPNGVKTVFSGTVELAEFVRRHAASRGTSHKHLVLHPRISVSGDDATVESYFVRLDSSESGPSYVWAMGRYHDLVRRQSDGIWRFVERHADIEDRFSDPM